MFRSRHTSHPVFVEEEFPCRRPRKRFRLRYLLIAALGLLLSAWAYQRLEASVIDKEVSLDDVAAGQLLLKSSVTGKQIEAVSQNSQVHIKVSGMVAHVSVQQTFRNQSQDWVEGVYAFPLPDKAAVNRMRMVVGQRVIEGQVKEKAEAKKVYDQAKAAGKKAGLVKQQRPNLFTTRVANIAPDETITVQLNYIETVAFDHGQFSLRFPMTITPRYIPGVPLNDTAVKEESLISSAMGWATATDEVPDASDITPWLNPGQATKGQLINPVTLTAELDMGMPLNVIESAYHNIVLSRQSHRYDVRLSEGRVSMNQDFVLTWQPQAGIVPKAAVFSEQVSGGDYALLMMVPPKTPASTLPKEMIYIIDTSGSMDGVSIKQARQSLLFALNQLEPKDRFNLIAFSSETKALFDKAVPANDNNIQLARRAVSRLKAEGGTEMLPALQKALADSAPEGFVRQLVFITDGAVGNETALFDAINKQLGSSRLFTVGIGSAPNSYFMRKAAELGRGTFTHVGQVNEVEQKMTELFAKLTSPVVTDISVNWPSGQHVESYPSRIPDLYFGEPLLLSIKTPDLRGDIVIKGKTAGNDWQQSIRVDQVQAHDGVATLWAREKIENLLDQKVTGRDPAEVRLDVLAVALRHQLVSPYTSFVAVEQVVSRPQLNGLASKPVLNAQPKGQGSQSYAYPQTATRALERFLWGLLLLLMAVVVKRCMSKEVEYGLVD